MRILIASDTYPPDVNGASYFTYRLATLLAKHRNQVFVIAPSQKLKRTVYVRDGVKIYGAPSIGIWVYNEFRFSPLFLSNKAIKKFVYEIRPDVIHIQNHFFVGRAVLQAAKKLHIPIIGTNHFMPENLIHYFHVPGYFKDKLKGLAWKQFSKVFNQLDVVTTPTQTAANLLKKHGFKKDVVIVSNGIDLERFCRRKGCSLRSDYNIPKNKRIILYTGRLDKEKRIDVILKAMPKIIRMVDARLILVGKGHERKNLESLANRLGISDKVAFTGFIPDDMFPQIYNIADVFVIAGIAELQSIVTMEALASALPIVSVDVMALPELVHNGENGYLFSMDNSDQLANAVIKILSDSVLRKKMAEKSLEIIRKHDIKNVIKTYESLYQETIRKNNA